MAAEILKVDYQTSMVVLDRLTMVTPLGVRFQDATTGEVIADGLSVAAHPINQPNARRDLFVNRRGVYVLRHAPGLRDVENGAGDSDYWNNLPAKKDFVIEVRDGQSRFVPFQFVVGLPVEWNQAVSPPPAIKSMPLYSAPTRTAPAGMAVVRADLWDPTRGDSGEVAPSVVLELYDNDRMVARGIADEYGKIALLFPYPAPRSFAVASPPGSPLSSPPMATTPALTDQVWTFRARAFYASELQSPPQTSTENSLPDLNAVLAQPEARLWADEARTEELHEVAVQFGQPLILKSRPPSMSPPTKGGSMLFITPAV
jgi:hypothetical protein